LSEKSLQRLRVADSILCGMEWIIHFPATRMDSPSHAAHPESLSFIVQRPAVGASHTEDVFVFGASRPRPSRRSIAMNTCPTLAPEPAEALTSSPIGQLRRLNVVADDSQVIITGQVSSYYLKQMAQETVRPLLGARLLLNHVEVSTDAA